MSRKLTAALLCVWMVVMVVVPSLMAATGSFGNLKGTNFTVSGVTSPGVFVLDSSTGAPIATADGGAGNVSSNTTRVIAATDSIDPCSRWSGVTKLYLPIDIVTATTTEITASLAGSSTHYYICALSLETDAANDVAIVDDNTDGCGSPTAGIFGGVTSGEGWNFAAGSGIALGNGLGAVGRTQTTNAVICIITSAATQLSGHMVVVAAS